MYGGLKVSLYIKLSHGCRHIRVFSVFLALHSHTRITLIGSICEIPSPV